MTKSKKKQKTQAQANEPHTPGPSIPDVRSVPTVVKRARSISQDRQSSTAPFHTPPTSPATPAIDIPSISAMMQEDPATNSTQPEPPPAYSSTDSVPTFTATDIASSNQDIIVMAELFATMKKTLVTMTGSLERLGSQSRKLVCCTTEIHAAEQVNQLRHALDEQILRQRVDIETLRLSLESKIKAEVEDRIRTHLRELVQDSLRETVRDKVREELEKQVPDHLRQQVIAQQRQILEVKTTLHNSEARRYNSLQTSPRANAPLRPLLRPLPTPEQSPVAPLLSRSTSLGSSQTPGSAMPAVPAPTPIRRSISNPLREPPTASAHFPPDLRTLFAMGPEQTRQLLRDYGLVSEAPTPAIEKPPGLPIVVEEPDVTSDEDKNAGIEEESHAADMNRFMAHIGVPFLMVPAPKSQEDPVTPMSSRTRRRMFLTPLIIK